MKTLIHFKVALTRSDLMRAAGEYLFYQPNNQLSFLLSILLAIVLSVGLFLNGFDFYLLAFLILVLASLGAYMVMPRMLAVQIEKRGTLNEPTTWTIERDAAVLQSGGSTNLLDWEKVRAHIETPGFFLLTGGAQGQVLHIIPHHAFETAAQADVFRRLLAAKARARKPILITGRSELLRLALLVVVLLFWIVYIFFDGGMAK